MDHAAELRQDRECIRIPLEQDLVALHRGAVFDQDARAVYHRIALLFTTLVIDHSHDAAAVHRNDLAGLAADRLDPDVARKSIGLRVLRGLLADPARRAADVERAHRQLRAGLTDGLRRDHTDRLAALHQPSRCQVAAIARDAHAALRFARQHRADLDALDTRRLNRPPGLP